MNIHSQQREMLHQLFAARLVTPWTFAWTCKALENGYLHPSIALQELGGLAGDWHTNVATHCFGATTWGPERI